MSKDRYMKVEDVVRFDDVRAYQERAIFTWDVSMTDFCNLGCSYCCVNCNSKDPATGIILSKENIDKAVKLITDMHVYENFKLQTQVKLYGGEPLLNPNTLYMCEELYKSFKRISKNVNKDLRMVVITNGTLLTDEFIDKIKEMRSRMGISLSLNISIDGYKENHDEYRKFKGGQPSYDTIIKNISKFYGPDGNMLMTQGVMTPDFLRNSDKVFKFVREETGKGLRAFGILPMNDTTFSSCTKEEIIEMFNFFHKNIIENIDLVKNGKFLIFQFARALSSLFAGDGEIGRMFCTAGSHTLHVMTSGKILPCHTFGYNNCDYMSMGYVSDEDILDKILAHRSKWKKITSVHPQCSSCKYGMIDGIGCIGGCVGHNWDNSRSNVTPDYVCLYNRCILDIALDLFKHYPRLFRSYASFKDKRNMYNLKFINKNRDVQEGIK